TPIACWLAPQYCRMRRNRAPASWSSRACRTSARDQKDRGVERRSERWGSTIHTAVVYRRGIPHLLLLDVTSPCGTAHENGRPAKRRQADQSGRPRALMVVRERPEEWTHGPFAEKSCSDE